MTTISMLDKLKTVAHLSNNVFNIAVIAFLVFISFLFITTNKNNAKQSRKAYIALYAILFIVVLIRYYNSLPTMFDYFMDNLFDVIYFPNIAVYIGAIIASNIIMLVSIFSTNTHKYIKVINVIISSFLDYLFVLAVNVINSKKIDVFNIESLYSNSNVHSLIELSSNIFVLWILFLVIFKIVISIIEKKNEKRPNKVTVKHVGYDVKKSFNEVKFPNNVLLTNTPVIIKRDDYGKKKDDSDVLYDGMFTKDDYRLMLSILKGEKDRKRGKIEISDKPKEKKGTSPLINLYK